MVQYRTENFRIVPEVGTAALAVSPPHRTPARNGRQPALALRRGRRLQLHYRGRPACRAARARCRTRRPDSSGTGWPDRQIRGAGERASDALTGEGELAFVRPRLGASAFRRRASVRSWPERTSSTTALGRFKMERPSPERTSGLSPEPGPGALAARGAEAGPSPFGEPPYRAQRSSARTASASAAASTRRERSSNACHVAASQTRVVSRALSSWRTRGRSPSCSAAMTMIWS